MSDGTRKVLKHTCTKLLKRKYEDLKRELTILQEDLGSEQKSTMGDKHETGRAMLHLELEKRSGQFEQVTEQLRMINQVSEKASDAVQIGSVVKTNIGRFYIAVSLGQVDVGGQKYYVVSPAAPIAVELMHKTPGDNLEFNNQQVTILEVT